ncbi:MAG TPA: apolipoprotein N-acyltransferase [Propionicimonas sp.]
MPGSRCSRRWAGPALAIAGGIATGAAFPGTSWWPLAPVGVALLLVALNTDSLAAAFRAGIAFGLAFFLPHLRWAQEAVGEPGPWLALSALEALAVSGFSVAWVWTKRAALLRRHASVRVAVASVLWVASEQVRSSVPFGGMPWGLLAFSQTDGPLVRLASVGGTILVTGVVVALGGVLADAVAALRTSARSGLTTRGLAVVALVTASMGIPLPTAPQTGSITVAAVQGDVPTDGADATSQARAVAANHVAGTRAILETVLPWSVDLIVWPESASDIDPRTDPSLGRAVQAVTDRARAPLLMGTQRFAEAGRYNDYVLWEPSRGATAVYTKRRPVPFGEYIPYRAFFRRLSPAVDVVTTDMVAGRGSGLLEVPVSRLRRNVAVGVAICFEVAYDELVRESVRAGAELIVVPTNNASFGRTQESTQQLAMSRFRAVEHGRAVVQISTVGVSALIAPDGREIDRTRLFTADQMVASLPLRTSLTISDRVGAWPARIVDLAALASLVLRAVARRRTR